MKKIENRFYIGAGVLAIILSEIAKNYAMAHRWNQNAIGGEILVSLVVYGLLFLVIRTIFSNLRTRPAATETTQQQPSCITATATVDSKGICRVVDATTGKKKTYKNLGEYVKTL